MQGTVGKTVEQVGFQMGLMGPVYQSHNIFPESEHQGAVGSHF